jgi:hypothetical protein
VDNSFSIEYQVALNLVFGDMSFARRYIDGLIVRANEEQAHVLSFGMMRYLSLYVHESHKAVTTVSPELAGMLAVDNADVIERSRHTVKLFDDTGQVGGAVGVTTQFDAIAGVHRDYFLDNTWFPPAKILETDMAVYHYRRRLIATTATMAFHLGLPPELIKDRESMGQALLSLSEGLARYINSFAKAVDWQGPSFMNVADLRAVKNKDSRSNKFYAGRFDPSLSDQAKAALVAFQCSMNFLALVLADDPNPASAGPVFKLKLVTLYHVLSSLAKFKAAFGVSLTRASSSVLHAILDHPRTALLTDADKKGLRNTLMHYIPRGPAVAQLDLSRPLYGLVEAYYPSLDFGDMAKLVDGHTTFVAESLDEWSAKDR